MKRFTHSRPRPGTRQRPRSSVRPMLELLEARTLLSITNVLVNNPAEDNGNFFGKTGLDTQSETAIVLGAGSNVVVAYNDDGQFTYPTPLHPNDTGYSLSTNGGGTFTDEGGPPPDGPYWPAGDPALARSSNTGTIFLSENSFNLNTVNDPTGGHGETVLIQRSTNNGATFSAPIVGTPGFVPGVDEADKPWIAVDNYPGPGFGNVYLVETETTSTGAHEGTFFTRSTDDGQTWGPSGGVLIGNKADWGAFVTVGPDHTVYVFSWNSNNPSENIQMTKSTDQGQTFSQPVIVTKLNNTNGLLGDLDLTYSNTNSSSFRTTAFPQAAVNSVTGDIYVVYNDQNKNKTGDKANIFFTMSTDGGNTWSNPLQVNDDATTTDQWQPAIALTPDGTHLFITWYDRRNDPVNDSLIDRYGVIGTISGHSVSFAPNFRITDGSFPPAFGQDPFVAPTYMGDYDMATADNNYFYTTWGDNRLSDAFFANQPDVRFAEIPVSLDDTVSRALAASSSVVPGTSGTGQSTAGSLNDSASLLVGVANAMAAQAPANPNQTLPGSQSGAIVPAVPASPPALPMDASAGQVPAPSISQLNPAAAMKALDLVFAGEGEDGLSDGLSLAAIGR
jgi:hypothetical protein